MFRVRESSGGGQWFVVRDSSNKDYGWHIYFVHYVKEKAEQDMLDRNRALRIQHETN